MKPLPKNDNWNDEDFSADVVEIEKVDPSLIKKLVNNIIKLELSDDFYLSFESLMKIGKKAESLIKEGMDKLDYDNNFKKEVLKILLKKINDFEFDNVFIQDLYNPDFITRFRAIKQIQTLEIEKYLKFLKPLINDADDSIRWAVINLLIENKQILNTQTLGLLEDHKKYELNPIIRDKLIEFFNQS